MRIRRLFTTAAAVTAAAMVAGVTMVPTTPAAAGGGEPRMVPTVSLRVGPMQCTMGGAANTYMVSASNPVNKTERVILATESPGISVQWEGDLKPGGSTLAQPVTLTSAQSRVAVAAVATVDSRVFHRKEKALSYKLCGDAKAAAEKAKKAAEKAKRDAKNAKKSKSKDKGNSKTKPSLSPSPKTSSSSSKPRISIPPECSSLRGERQNGCASDHRFRHK